jgi:hypothetical protein
VAGSPTARGRRKESGDQQCGHASTENRAENRHPCPKGVTAVERWSGDLYDGERRIIPGFRDLCLSQLLRHLAEGDLRHVDAALQALPLQGQPGHIEPAAVALQEAPHLGLGCLERRACRSELPLSKAPAARGTGLAHGGVEGLEPVVELVGHIGRQGRGAQRHRHADHPGAIVGGDVDGLVPQEIDRVVEGPLGAFASLVQQCREWTPGAGRLRVGERIRGDRGQQVVTLQQLGVELQ